MVCLVGYLFRYQYRWSLFAVRFKIRLWPIIYVSSVVQRWPRSYPKLSNNEKWRPVCKAYTDSYSILLLENHMSSTANTVYYAFAGKVRFEQVIF